MGLRAAWIDTHKAHFARMRVGVEIPSLQREQCRVEHNDKPFAAGIKPGPQHLMPGCLSPQG